VFPLHLYARVRISSCINAHETAGAARTRSSLRPLFEEGANDLQTSDNSCRENEDSHLVVLANARTHTPCHLGLSSEADALCYQSGQG
jgi:hypothetical protein